MFEICRVLSCGVVVGLVLAILPRIAFSQQVPDNDVEEVPWQEIEAKLPPFPEDENLIPFKTGPVTDMRFTIDGKSISVDSDEVIRYTLVTISPSGAKTISYEGMRCSTTERRTYAFGRADKTWSKPRSSKWVSIRGGADSWYVALARDYFCTIGESAILNPDHAIRVLQRGRPKPGG